VILLQGCWSVPQKIEVSGSTKTNELIATLQKEVDTLNARVAESSRLEDSASGAVYGAIVANKQSEDSKAKEATQAELGLAQRILGEPTEQSKLEAGKRVTAVLTGQLDEIRKLYKDAESQLIALQGGLASKDAEIVKLHSNVESLKIESDKEIKKHAAKIADLIADKEKQLAKAKDEATQYVMKQQVLWLNISGGICILIFAAGIGFGGGIAGLRMTWIFGVIGLLAFGLAQIVSQWWFMWAVLTAIVIALGICVYWGYRQYKNHTLKESLQDKANKATDVINAIVPVLDNAWNDADTLLKKSLDDLIFSKLGNQMDKEQKATIHLVRSSLTK